jgi:hypothetical protein
MQVLPAKGLIHSVLVGGTDGASVVVELTGRIDGCAGFTRTLHTNSAGQVIGGKCWTAPILANGRIYCRSSVGDIVCVDVRKDNLRARREDKSACSGVGCNSSGSSRSPGVGQICGRPIRASGIRVITSAADQPSSAFLLPAEGGYVVCQQPSQKRSLKYVWDKASA